MELTLLIGLTVTCLELSLHSWPQRVPPSVGLEYSGAEGKGRRIYLNVKQAVPERLVLKGVLFPFVLVVLHLNGWELIEVTSEDHLNTASRLAGHLADVAQELVHDPKEVRGK